MHCGPSRLSIQAVFLPGGSRAHELSKNNLVQDKLLPTANGWPHYTNGAGRHLTYFPPCTMVGLKEMMQHCLTYPHAISLIAF